MRGMSMIVAAKHGPGKHLEGSSLSLAAGVVAMAFLAVMLTAQKASASWFGRQEQASQSNDQRGAQQPGIAVPLPKAKSWISGKATSRLWPKFGGKGTGVGITAVDRRGWEEVHQG